MEGDDIIDINKISGLFSISIDRDHLILDQAMNEYWYNASFGGIAILSGSIDVGESEDDGRDMIFLVEVMEVLFSGIF